MSHIRILTPLYICVAIKYYSCVFFVLLCVRNRCGRRVGAAAERGKKIFTLPRRGRMGGGGSAPCAADAVVRVASAGALDGAAAAKERPWADAVQPLDGRGALQSPPAAADAGAAALVGGAALPQGRRQPRARPPARLRRRLRPLPLCHRHRPSRQSRVRKARGPAQSHPRTRGTRARRS